MDEDAYKPHLPRSLRRHRYEHNMFPLIHPAGTPKEGALFGTILRDTLVVLMNAHAFSTSSQVCADNKIEGLKFPRQANRPFPPPHEA
jgi:hypothetical protein